MSCRTFLYFSLLLLLLLPACAPARAGQDGAGLALAYAGYPELAAAVRRRIDGPSSPTPALAALARELTAGRADAHARACALADWVRGHIRRTDARLRLDGAPPRPAAAVLAQRSGNGEELVVLLRALLAESAIDSTAALLRRGQDDTLPEAALSAAFDHMLVYVPGLGLYLDPGADSIAAGYLPPSLLGKPVLLASGGFAMTPLAQAQSVSTRAAVDIGRDGKGAVTFERTYTGALAEPVRKAVRDAPQAREQFLRRMLPGLAPQGRALPALQTADLDGDGFRMSLSGVGAQFVALPGARVLPTVHPWLSTVADAVAGMPWDSAGGRMMACPAIDAADETRYRLPKQARILALPPAVSVIRGGVFYRAAYERQGNAVLVTRRLSFRNGRPACTPAEVRAMRPALERVARDLRSTVAIALR